MAKILVADDAYFVRIKSRNFLEEHGHEVIEAENGRRALELYEEHQPDLVFSDITMPDMDGLDFLKAVMAKYPAAKVIMLTSRSEQSVLMEALTVGAKNYLVKPFDEAKVLELIKTILG